MRVSKSQQDEEFDDFVDRVDDVGTYPPLCTMALADYVVQFSNISLGGPLKATPCSLLLFQKVVRFACISALGNAIPAFHHLSL